MARFDAQSLRRAFGSFMTGVTVVTARSGSGELVGFTANSFSSVSMQPPLLLVCPGNHLSSFEVFKSASHFAVNVLAEGQESVSNVFASAVDNRFEQVQWHDDEFGSPLIDGAVATFSCSACQRHSAGDHLVLIGEVHSLEVNDGMQGLGYCSNGYFSLSDEQQSDTVVQPGHTAMAGAIVECGGRVLINRDKTGPSLPCIKQAATTGARGSLQKHFAELGLNVELGTVYSIYDDPRQKSRYTFIRAQVNGSNSEPDTSVPELSGPGSFETLESLDSLVFHDSAQATMMARYAAESRLNSFGLYVGNALCGDIHPLAEPQD